ncbi:MAG: hypothetical protein RSE41_09800, partial [Clostridia bacterium]
MEIVTYIDRFRKNSDAVDKEISYLSDGKTDPKIDFWNGSTIRVVAANDNSRGKRANILIVDEYRLVPLEIVTMVLRKFRSSTRDCGFLKKPQYKGYMERNKEVYLSSTYYKHSWAYKHFLSFIEMMKSGGNSHFTCCLPYQLAVMEGIKNLEELQEEYDEGVDEQLWKMEYETWWIGSDDEMSFFKFDNIDPCRRVTKPLYPKEILELVDQSDKFFNTQKKRIGEIRVLFADIARKESTTNENDATALGVMSLTETEDKRLNASYFMRDVSYLETFTGQNTVVQALRMRKLFDWFECDYFVIDAQNIGASIIDLLSLPMTDPETGVEYPPINAINHEELKLGTVLYPNAPKVIYGIMATASLNSTIGYAMRDTLAKRRIRFLIDEASSRQQLASIKGYDLISPELKGKLQQPYLQCTALVNEMVGLDYRISPDTNILRLSEKAGNRKDRCKICLDI